MGKRVVGYIRRSIENDNLSLQAQEKSIKAFIDSQGWELIGLYCDSGDSGKNTDRRQYQKMLCDLRSHSFKSQVDLILVPKLDRISRSLKDILILIEDQLGPCGVGLKSVTESFDSSSSEGKLMLSLLGGFAEFERKRIVERMMDGKHQKAEVGGWNGGHPPYGYKIDGQGKLIPHDVEAKILRTMFELFANNNVSVPHLKRLSGCTLHSDTIYDLLSNPVYVGWLIYSGVRTKGIHEKLVSARLFNRVQEQKLKRSRSNVTIQKLFKVSGMDMISMEKIISEKLQPHWEVVAT